MVTTPTELHRLRWWASPLLSPAIAFLALFLLFLEVTPPASAPDESSHFVRLGGVLRGQLVGAVASEAAFPIPNLTSAQAWRVRQESGFVDVGPDYLYIVFSDCNTGKPEMPACASPRSIGVPGVTRQLSTHGRAPVGGYLAPALLSALGWSGRSTFYLARLGTAAEVLLMLMLSVAAVRRADSTLVPAVVASIAVAYTPLAAFLSGVVAPAAIGIAGTVALLCATWAVVRRPIVDRTDRVIWLVALAVACTSERIGYLFAALAIVAGTLSARSTPRELLRRLSRRATLAAAVIVGVGVVWDIAFTVRLPANEPLWSIPILLKYAADVWTVTFMAHSYLGYLDVVMPAVVTVLWVAMFSWCIFGGVVLSDRRWMYSAVLLAVLYFALGIVFAHRYAPSGFGLQARFFLPGIVIFPIASVLQLSTVPGLSWRLLRPRLLIGAWTAGMIAAVVTLAHRHVVGSAGPWWFFQEGQFRPLGGWWLPALTLVVFLIAAIATVRWRSLFPIRSATVQSAQSPSRVLQPNERPVVLPSDGVTRLDKPPEAIAPTAARAQVLPREARGSVDAATRASGLEWMHGETHVRCPMCGDDSVKECLLRIDFSVASHVVASRCSHCESIVVEGCEPEIDTSNDLSVDVYIDQFAGIQPIFEQLARCANAGVVRFADVGCNFGFGVDIATRLFGWDAEGFEPSYAAARGSRELTSRIRREPLLESTVVAGGRFDLILASEVLEHVEDPRGFISGLMAHLADGGTLVVTTPSAQAVRRSLAPGLIRSAMSPGHHRFLASKGALSDLLAAAGLADLEITDDGRQLVATARRRPAQSVERPPAGGELLLRYLDLLAEATDVSPRVRLAGAVRHYKQLVLRGLLEDAETSRRRLNGQLMDRLGWSLSDLAIVRDRVHGTAPLPAFVSSLMFVDGIRALLSGDPRSGADQFELSVQARDKLWRETLGDGDLETAELSLMAAAHLVLAQARVQPSGVVDSLNALDRRAAGCAPKQQRAIERVVAASFVTLVHGAAYDTATEVGPRIDAMLAGLLGGEPLDRHAGLDALFCRGLLALHRGGPSQAREAFWQCCDETADDQDPHAAQLFASSIEHAIGWAPRAVAPPRGGVIQFLDVYWVDARGIYVSGFAFVPGHPATRVRLHWGAVSLDAGAPTRHDGAASAYGSDPAALMCGFAAHLMGPLAAQLTIELETEGGTRRVDVDLPSHPLPDWPLEANPDVARRALIETMVRTAPAGPVIALGTRKHTDEGTAVWRDQFSGREVIGVDIHPGPGVDLVADAHCLSGVIEPGSAAAFVSDEVFEHLEAPWLVAHQVQRILRVGGLALVSAPMIWPEHAAPNDFWRISPFGLRSLFGPALGFRVIASGGWGDVAMMPGPLIRTEHPGMPTMFGPSIAYVLARKETELSPDSVHWPYDASAGAERARLYPYDAVGTGG